MNEQIDLYQFKGQSKDIRVNSKPLAFGRYLIGSIDTCGIQISHPSVNPIHAVLEVTPNGTKIYSLNAESTVLVNGDKVPVAELKEGDTVKIGQAVLDFDKFDRSFKLPTVPTSEVPKGSVHSKTKSVITEESVKAPHLIYPFDQDFNFESSEYIFEDNDNIYPIFKYDLDQYAVEVIIIHKKRIFSVDYIPSREGMYRLAGVERGANDIRYPYLGEKDTTDFVECRGGSFFINKLQDYSIQLFSDNSDKLEGSTIHLERNDVVSFQKGDLSIVVRNVDSPPHVAAPPLLPRDKSLLSMIFLAFLLVTIPMYFIFNLEIDKEKIEKEKAPERIAKILYNRRKFQKVVKTKPKPQPKAVEKAALKPKPVKKVTKPKPGPKIKTPKKPVKKGTPPKKVTKKPTPAPPKPKAKSRPAPKKTSKSVGKKRTKTTTKSPTPKKRGTVDVYRNNNFKSTISSILAKGGEFKGIKTQGNNAGSVSAATSASVAGGGGVSSATVSDKLGSPTGSRDGVQTFSSGAEGLTGTKTFYTAGIPSETVIVGSMDPDIIRKILRDHIPQFRFCYQKELDKNNSRTQGVVKMVFTIGASGSVSRAGVQGASRLPSPVKRCVVNVLRGIQFPKPLGGGTVEVKQPINFYPRSK